jgi:hypothetical protein
MYVWTIPDELCFQINKQFIRFNAPLPSERALNEIGESVIEYVSKHNYFPSSYDEYMWRSSNPYMGLSEPEKMALIAPLEYKIKVHMLEKITFDQIHLAIWASLMWCWSEEGVKHVLFHQEAQRKTMAQDHSVQVTYH